MLKEWKEKIIQLKEKYLNIETIKENKKIVIAGGCILALIIVFAGFFALNYKNNKALEELKALSDQEENSEEIEAEDNQTLIVDIGGEVKNPMIAQLPTGSRIGDAITAAGGTTEKADLSNINRAQVLEDGQKIYIPSTDDSNSQASINGSSSSTASSSNQKVNINTATDEQLRTLSGVGPATAEKIINFRTKEGAFKSIEDLKNVDGIGDKTFEKLKDKICV